MAALAVAGAADAAGRRQTLQVSKPDLATIEEAVTNPASPYFFPKLQERFEAIDTAMTAEEYRYFYLGYMFQEDYDPYRISHYTDSTEALLSRGGNYTPHEVDTIIYFTERALEDNPLDLRQMSFLVHFLREKGKNQRYRIWEYRLRNLLGAILSTGTGLDADNAWYVVYPMHEYDVMQFLGYQVKEAQYPRPGIDQLKVSPYRDARRFQGTTPQAFYFNVEIPMQEYELKHPGEEEQEAAE